MIGLNLVVDNVHYSGHIYRNVYESIYQHFAFKKSKKF